MDIIVNFGYRKYIFYSVKDVIKATSIYAKPGTQDDFENRLEDEKIEFNYNSEDIFNQLYRE